jgi:hypothetical protein
LQFENIITGIIVNAKSLIALTAILGESIISAIMRHFSEILQACLAKDWKSSSVGVFFSSSTSQLPRGSQQVSIGH